MKDNTAENSHKSILKATGIFGFTQIMKMVIGIIGSKFVAVFLGPIGIGIMGLLTNTISIISSVTNFGLNITSVREVTLAQADNNSKLFSERYIILQRLCFIVGLIGAIVTIIFSKLLSYWTFGSSDNYLWFVILSLNFVIINLTIPKIALLQGMRMIKFLAISNVVISLFIAFFTIPIYYFFRLKGIVPVILVSSFIGLMVNIYFTRNIKIEKLKISFSETIKRGTPLLKMGFLLSINVIFGQICIYIIKLYLNGNGSTAEILGFYEVSTVLLISYVGMIFNAMSTDFYPRLTAVSENNFLVKELVNDQIEIALLLITPAISLFYFLSPLVIQILYTKQFLGVLFILKAALLAVIIKAIIWPLGYIILAKGQTKLYFKQELLSDLFFVLATIGFYHYFGLVGIGISSVLHYTLYGFYVYFILKKNFEFSIRKNTLSIINFSVIIGLANSLTVFLLDYPVAYFPLGIIFLISVIFSFKELNNRVNIHAYLLKIKTKFRN